MCDNNNKEKQPYKDNLRHDYQDKAREEYKDGRIEKFLISPSCECESE